MKILISLMLACMVVSAMAVEKGGKEKPSKVKQDDAITKMWQEMLAENKEYDKMKSEGASVEELKLQETLIKELYATVIAMKKDMYGDAGTKSGAKKASGPIMAVWQEMLAEKEKYGVMQKDGAPKAELAEQKAVINALYKEVLAMKKSAQKK
ncbi:MAG: hypothetical protein MK132_25370 [Lentisphaerales bacterium]|nr:hypothetical protein [Lentisphaerales bacterium]